MDHQLTQSNRFSGKFFFSNQPSRDPLANGNALTRHEREEQTRQRTFSFTDLHIFSPTVVNEFRAGFFRNRNDNDPVAYFTNAEFGIAEPARRDVVPDLTQVTIDGDRTWATELQIRHAGRRHTRLRRADDLHDRQHADLQQGAATRSGPAASCGGTTSTATCRKDATGGTTSGAGSTS